MENVERTKAELLAEIQRLQARVGELEDPPSPTVASFFDRYPSLVLENMSEAVLVIDGTRRLCLCNRAAEQIYGWSAGDMLGKDLLDDVIPLEGFLDGGTLDEIRATVAAGGVWCGSTIHRHRDGRRLVIESTVRLLAGRDGQRVGTVVIGRDVTAAFQAQEVLRASEARYRLLAEHARDLITLIDHHGQILYASPSHQLVLGYDPADLIHTSVFSLFHPDDVLVAQNAALQTLARATMGPLELRQQKRGGEWLYVEAILSVVASSDGAAQQILLASRDINERKRLEAHLLQAQKMESVGRLAGGVAHDFNNLLTAISGFTALAMDSVPADSPALSDLQEVQKATEQAAHLTEQLLAFARKQTINPHVIVLDDLIGNIHKLIQRLIGENIELVTLLDATLGRISVDPGQLEQLVVNLAVNARDAMPEGGVLQIRTLNTLLLEPLMSGSTVLQPGPYVVLSVSDTGVGMTSATQAHIFEPFFTTKEKGRGTGLGLATCYGIVKQHGGAITCYSDAGQGTSFTIYFPQADHPTPVPAGAPPAAVALPGGTESILLVEDETAVRTLAVRVLGSLGYTVIEAANGEEALELLDAQATMRIDLLLTDMIMPRVGGQLLANRVRSVKPDVRIVFMSGYLGALDLSSTLPSTREDFLQKPFTPESLARKVRAVLDRR